MSKGTPARNVRVPDDLWGRALARAEEEGTSVSAVIVRALEEWVAGRTEVRDGDLFLGFEPRGCGEHRTVGSYRAWCFDCSEWCYPQEPCARCGSPNG